MAGPEAHRSGRSHQERHVRNSRGLQGPKPLRQPSRGRLNLKIKGVAAEQQLGGSSLVRPDVRANPVLEVFGGLLRSPRY